MSENVENEGKKAADDHETEAEQSNEEEESTSHMSEEEDRDKDQDSCDADEERRKGSKKSPWNGLEDSRLRSIIQSNSYADENGRLVISMSWGEVAEMIPRRTAKQCRERWCYNLDPNIKQTAWSVEEDAILIKAQTRLHNQWALISKHLPGRTENAVKTRFKSVMRAKKREWKQEEDARIFELLRTYGSKWDQIKKHFPNRTANAIKTRFSQLKKGNFKESEVDAAGCARQIWLNVAMIDSIPLDYLTKDRGQEDPKPQANYMTSILPQMLQIPPMDLVPNVSFSQSSSNKRLRTMETPMLQQMDVAAMQPLPMMNVNMGSNDASKLIEGFSKISQGIVDDRVLSFEEKATLLQQSQSVLSNFMLLQSKHMAMNS